MRKSGGDRSQSARAPRNRGNLIWANLLHLGFNMWCDRNAEVYKNLDAGVAKPFLRFDQDLWDDLLKEMADAGMNMVLIDLGEGVKYDSHPELGVKGSWTPAKLRRELAKVRALGLEPIPKLNFSAAHDIWLGPYSRCVSTDKYYTVCRDLIAETLSLFDRPRFLHLGMDEETASHQQHSNYVVVRQHELWWHDLLFLVGQVEKGGSRAWVWSDQIWREPEEYVKKMPRSVLQSNWYYGGVFKRKLRTGNDYKPYDRAVESYHILEEHGFDQVPSGACTDPYNYLRMVDYCKRHIAPERLLGFMQTVWYPTLNTQRARHLDAIAKVRVGMDCWNGKIRNVNVENPRTPLDIPDKPGIRVGVYGSGIGDLGILEALAGAKDLNAFSLPRLDRKSLSQTEVLVIPVPSSQAFYSSAKNLLCRWVAGGGRIMLLHSAVGYRHFSPLFPKLAKALTHPRSQTVHVVARHPVTAGLSIGEKFDHSYKDHVAMKPGAGARVLVKDEQGYGVVIAGKAGRGKVLLNGMITGYASVGPVELDQAPQGGERDVLINGIRWLGSH